MDTSLLTRLVSLCSFSLSLLCLSRSLRPFRLSHGNACIQTLLAQRYPKKSDDTRTNYIKCHQLYGLTITGIFILYFGMAGASYYLICKFRTRAHLGFSHLSRHKKHDNVLTVSSICSLLLLGFYLFLSIVVPLMGSLLLQLHARLFPLAGQLSSNSLAQSFIILSSFINTYSARSLTFKTSIWKNNNG